jgi:hypothetical protein
VTDAVADDAPSPWLPCPECGRSVWFKATVTFERGEWLDEDTYEINLEVPPHITAYQSGPETIECIGCGHRFGLKDLGYKIEPENEENDG